MNPRSARILHIRFVAAFGTLARAEISDSVNPSGGVLPVSAGRSFKQNKMRAA
jgi:hypothetical protein